jgi:hypothetical protein
MRKDRTEPARVDPLEFEQECETWDWARAAGVSVLDLHQALRDALRVQASNYSPPRLQARR